MWQLTGTSWSEPDLAWHYEYVTCTEKNICRCTIAPACLEIWGSTVGKPSSFQLPNTTRSFDHNSEGSQIRLLYRGTLVFLLLLMLACYMSKTPTVGSLCEPLRRRQSYILCSTHHSNANAAARSPEQRNSKNTRLVLVDSDLLAIVVLVHDL